MLYNPSSGTGIISQQPDEIPLAFLVVLAVNPLRFCLSENAYSLSSFLKYILLDAGL